MRTTQEALKAFSELSDARDAATDREKRLWQARESASLLVSSIDRLQAQPDAVKLLGALLVSARSTEQIKGSADAREVVDLLLMMLRQDFGSNAVEDAIGALQNVLTAAEVRSAAQQYGRLAKGKAKNPHQQLALDMYDELRSSQRSDAAAYAEVAKKIAEKFNGAPSAETVRRWIKAR